MAITKRVRILVRAHADGVSDTFSFDLMSDPYWVGEESTKGYGGRITNWFADPDIKHGAAPTGVVVIDGAISAALTSTAAGDRAATAAPPASAMVTVKVPVQPDGALYEVTLGLVFA
jgi:hypothetical protein